MDKFCPEQPAVEALEFFSGKFYKSGSSGEQGIIFAATDVFPGTDQRSPLPDNNVSRIGVLPIGDFNAEPLGLRISAKSSGTTSFFMRHN